MTFEIALRRKLVIHCWRVVGMVAKESERSELVPILLRAQEKGQTNADDIATHLFFESRARRVVARRLLDIAATHGLLEKAQDRYLLTNAGHEAIHTRRVLVPEYGTWSIWTSMDPLLGCRILRVEPWREPSAYHEVRGGGRKAPRAFERLPAWLAEMVGHTQRPCADDSPSIRVDELKDEGEAVDADATLQLEWTVGGGRLRVTGHLAGHDVDADLEPPACSLDEVWSQLLEQEGIWSSWDDSRKTLRVDFDSTDDEERQSMSRTLRIARPHLDALGAFDATEVRGLRLAPLSPVDAQRWATWRLQARIENYATEGRIEEWTRAATEPFAGAVLDMPSRSDLARDAWLARTTPPSPRTWHLVAAEDWRLR